MHKRGKGERTTPFPRLNGSQKKLLWVCDAKKGRKRGKSNVVPSFPGGKKSTTKRDSITPGQRKASVQGKRKKGPVTKTHLIYLNPRAEGGRDT